MKKKLKHRGASLLTFASCVFSTGLLHAEDPISFQKDIFPIFEKKCAGCHFPTSELKGGLDLSTAELALKGGKNGEVITPGKADDSVLVQMIEYKLEPSMPPPKQFKQLKREEIDVIKRWIDAGAKPDAAPAPASPAEKPVLGLGAEPAPAPSAEAKPAPDVKENPPAKPEKEIAALPRESTPMPAAPVKHSAAAVGALAFSPNAPLLARGGLHTVELLSVQSETGAVKVEATLPDHADLVRALAFSPDGSLLAAAGGKPAREGEIKIWKIADRSLIRTIKGHKDNLLDVAFSPDGKLLASASYDKLVKIWNVETGEEVRTLKNHVDAVYAVAFSPDGKTLASAAGDRTVKLWDVAEGKLTLTLSDALDAVLTVAFDPSGRFLAAGSADKMLRVWDLGASQEKFNQSAVTAGSLVGSSFAHEGAVLKVLYSPDGKSIYTTSEDRRIKMWDAATLAEKMALEPQPDWVTALALSPDGKRLAAGRYDSTSAIYAADTGKALWSSVASKSMEMKSDEKPATAKAEEGGRKKITSLGVEAVVIKATIPPSITSVSPSMGSRGAELELSLSGKNLEGAKPIFGLPGGTLEIVQNEALPIPEPPKLNGPRGTGADLYDNAQPFRLKLKAKIPEDAPLGAFEIILDTPLGLTGGFIFTVNERPDTPEAEPNDTPENAQKITSPVVVSGRIERSGDIDRYRIEATGGQELGFILTQSMLNPSMRILDAAGKELATSENFGDAKNQKLGFQFPAAGSYLLEIGDRDLRGGLSYRLNVGEFPLVTGVFPLGVVAGAGPQKVSVRGFNIGGAREIEIKPPDTATYGQKIGLPIEVKPGMPVAMREVAVGSSPELIEAEPNETPDKAQPLAFPSTVNARLWKDGAAGGDSDLYRITGRKGEKIILETMAARLGSPVDTVIEILDMQGKPLERALARCVSQTFVTLSGRDAKSAGIRLDAWKDFQLKDYLMVGSEIVQITRLPGYADEDVSLRAYSTGQRMGFFGTTPEYHAVNQPVYKVEIHPPGSKFAPNGMPVNTIYWRNDDNYWEGAASDGDSQLVFEPPADGDYLVRVTDAGGAQGEDHAYRLSLRRSEPDFRIAAGIYRANVNLGGRIPVNVRAIRQDDFAGPVEIRAEGLPEGFAMTGGTILAGEQDVELALSALPGAKTMPLGSTFKLVAEGEINGKKTLREATIGSINVVEKQPDLIVRNGEKMVELVAGRGGHISLKLERFNGFTSRTPITVLNLPEGVRPMNTGLNGILVRDGEFDRTIELYAEPWVKPMSRPIYIQARIETRSVQPVFIGEPLELRIVPEPMKNVPASPIAWNEGRKKEFLAAL